MTLHATIRPCKLFVENFLKKFSGTQKTPTTRNEWRGFSVRGDKGLWSGSGLITLSSWPCCRGGVRACVVCVYLDIVTWTGREVSITNRFVYGWYTIDTRPHPGCTMHHTFWDQ